MNYSYYDWWPYVANPCPVISRSDHNGYPHKEADESFDQSVTTQRMPLITHVTGITTRHVLG